VLFALCLPTNLLLLGASMGAASRQEPDLILARDEVLAYRWVASSVPAGALVLTGGVSGNRLPAYAPVRVLYGHPFETPDAAKMNDLVDSFFAGDRTSGERMPDLRALSIRYVLVGPRERAAGPLEWLKGLRQIYESDGFAVYEVPAR
jgi:hypothetical protein